jgi:hypothetical protein
MQGQTKSTNASLFDSIFNAIAPAEAVKAASLSKKKKTVYDIFFENRTDYVHVTLDCYDQEGEEMSSDIFILHADLHRWLKDTRKLEMSVGSNHMEGGEIVEDEQTMEIGYIDYIEVHMSNEDIKEFILFKSLPYEFDSSI